MPETDTIDAAVAAALARARRAVATPDALAAYERTLEEARDIAEIFRQGFRWIRTDLDTFAVSEREVEYPSPTPTSTTYCYCKAASPTPSWRSRRVGTSPRIRPRRAP